MTTLDEMEELDPFKKLVYELCNFLIKRRRTPEGVGLNNPIYVFPSELRHLFEYMPGARTNRERIAELRRSLELLCHNSDIATGTKPILRLNPPDIVANDRNFKKAFDNDERLQFAYTSRDMEEFQNELKDRTEAMRRSVEGFQIEVTPKGHLRIYSSGREMLVRKRRKGIPISINLIMLLYGHEIKLPSGRMSIEDLGCDYQRGSPVEIDVMVNLLYGVEQETPSDEMKKRRKSVTDQIERLIKRSHLKLGTPIFESDDGEIRWVL